MRSGRNEDKDPRKTSRDVGRNPLLGTLSQYLHWAELPFARCRPTIAHIPRGQNVWGHISRRIQQLPLNSRVESLTSFLTWFHLEPRSSREEETYRTDLLSNHRSINRRVSRISNFLNSSIDFFGKFACSEGKVSCDSYNCGSRFFARILWRKGYHRWRMRIRSYRWMVLNSEESRRISFLRCMHACMHFLDGIEKYWEIDRYFLSYRVSIDTCSIYSYIFFFIPVE